MGFSKSTFLLPTDEWVLYVFNKKWSELNVLNHFKNIKFMESFGRKSASKVYFVNYCN